MKIRNERVVKCRDWDKLVKETYGRPYCFQQQDGCKQRGRYHLTVPTEAEDYESDTVPELINHEEMGVSFAAWLKRDPKQPIKDEDSGKVRSDDWGIELWWERNFYPTIEMVANDLHDKGLLKAGKYTIDIDW